MFDLLTSLLARARSLFYDNSSSGLTANNVQEAIDELALSGGSQPYTTLTDPALNSITQNMIDTKGGVVITLTGAGNNQTLPAPTDTSIAHEFTVINNDTSTDPINIIGASTVQIDPGKKVKWTYDGSAWIASDAEGIWYDDGTDIKAQNSTRNINVQTGKFKAGSNTEISESSGDTLIENTSATNDIIEKLGDNLGSTSKKIVDSTDITFAEFLSSGIAKLGKVATACIVYIKNAAGVAKIVLDSTKGIFNYLGQVNNVTVVTDSTYTLLETDYIINSKCATACTRTLPSAQAVITGQTYKIIDGLGNASSQDITINTEGSETINGQPSILIQNDWESREIISDGTNWIAI